MRTKAAAKFTLRGAKGQVIGTVVGDEYRKTITGSKHMLRKPPAIAFDSMAIERALAVGAKWAVVKDRETGKTYRATIEHLRERGFEFNRGFGRQIALVIEEWATSGRQDRLL